MNKNELITKLRELDSLTFEEKSQLIDLINRKRYGLVWEDKPEDAEEVLNETLPVLSEVIDKAIIYNSEKQKNKTLFENSKDEIPNHILIEGDNLHALTTLCFTHENKIDVIYIDPPYNTGNKDFRYFDSRFEEVRDIDKENPFRHSMWLSFMSKRLKIAKRLLKETGVTFISIDDNEVAQLKLLCDDIFREENYLTTIVRRRRKTQANLTKNIAPVHEYIVCYAKNISSLQFNKLTYSKEFIKKSFSNPDKDSRGLYQTGPLARPENSSNKEYILEMPNGRKIKAKWSCSQETFDRYVQEKRLVIPREGKGMPRIKIFLNETKGALPNTWWDDIASNEEGAKEIENIFGTNAAFIFPKPTDLIRTILQIASNKNSVILDFFAGSGTTLHATMALNSEDEGKRQCILVTDNENKICEEVTYIRNKKVIEGYTKPNKEKVEGLVKNNFRYYKTAFVGREKTLKNKRQLTELATDLLCIKENCYKEIKGAKQIRIFQENSISIVIIYDDIVIPNAVELIKKLPKDHTIKVYVFVEGQDPYTEDFEEVLDRIQLCTLPDAIYKAYQNILPKKRKIEMEVETVN